MSEINNPEAKCTNCEYPATPDNPIVLVQQDNGTHVMSHVHCPTARSRRWELEELASRNASLWSFAAVNKFVPPQPDQSTNQETFPSPKTHKVTPMTRTVAAPEYEDGSIPVPPQN